MTPRGTQRRESGLTLIESLVAVVVFLIISVAVYQAFIVVLKAVAASRTKLTATVLASEQFEIMRNLPYEDVGTVNGLPVGILLPAQTLERDGRLFTITTVIRSVDDPFDGVIGGEPNDLSPADYKLASVDIACDACKNFQTMRFTTMVAPRSLETTSNNGALFVKVIDAAGQPIAGAAVHIENNLASPAISVSDTTNASGVLQIVDAPPGVEAYEIEITKVGHTSDQTYPSGALENPNPLKPHATVAVQQVTQVTFIIDQVSTVSVASRTETCAVVPNVDFTLMGTRLIGTNPDVYKYDSAHVTNGSGTLSLNGLEWDTYNVSVTDALYDIAGMIPIMPLALNPGASQDISFILTAKNPQSLLVTVRDAASSLPLSGATVRLTAGAYDESLVTGRGFLRQTDWSGGSGQETFVDETGYFSDDGNIDTGSPAGDVRLKDILGEFAAEGYLISSTFDTGSVSNFHEIRWQPGTQPPEAGVDSVRFHIATNNDSATWNFAGPDGTENTYYTESDQAISVQHNGDRYFRYKLFMQTADVAYTPAVSDVSFTFTSDCVPPGQVLFDGLSGTSYDLSVSREGYQTFSDVVSTGDPWQAVDVSLSP